MVFKDIEAILTNCAKASNVKLVCLLCPGNCAFMKYVRRDIDVNIPVETDNVPLC